MATRSESLLSWLALPVYIWQGLAVRRNSLRLEPPAHSGWIEAKSNGARQKIEPIRILLIGDSSAAGVGVRRIEDSLGGQLPGVVSELTGKPVRLRIAGNNSATSSQIRDFVLPHLEPEPYDFICLNIGTNDAKNWHRGNTFCKNFGSLLYALRTKFPSAKIVWSGIIDMQGIPALPSPLNKILGIRSRILNRNGKILCLERGALAPDPEWQVIPENFAIDGFHASEKGYREWAENLGKYLVELEG
ncbi:MAG: SGNH/GDSL hydrolase family protein [Salaquimonas sp.]